MADWEKMCSRLRSNKAKALSSGQEWIATLQKDVWTAADFEALLANHLIVERKKKTSSFDWLNIVHDELHAIITEASDANRIFTWLASYCQRLVHRVLQAEEIRGSDQLLSGMVQAVQDPRFVQQIQQRYRAAVVDEFQDTDPQQWSILEALFPIHGDTYLTVVGDPKQSIYAFRQADIYTYQNAAQTFPEQGRLNTNYRSQPALVSALNTLYCPGFIALPKSSTYIDAEAVNASPTKTDHPFRDHRKPLHFLIIKAAPSPRAQTFPNLDYQQEHLFPCIAQEIARLHREEGFRWNQIALLVRDRRQGKALLNLLKQWKIPAATQQSDSLLEAKILPAMIELLEGFLQPADKSPLKRVLGAD